MKFDVQWNSLHFANFNILPRFDGVYIMWINRRDVIDRLNHLLFMNLNSLQKSIKLSSSEVHMVKNCQILMFDFEFTLSRIAQLCCSLVPSQQLKLIDARLSITIICDSIVNLRYGNCELTRHILPRIIVDASESKMKFRWKIHEENCFSFSISQRFTVSLITREICSFSEKKVQRFECNNFLISTSKVIDLQNKNSYEDENKLKSRNFFFVFCWKSHSWRRQTIKCYCDGVIV